MKWSLTIEKDENGLFEKGSYRVIEEATAVTTNEDWQAIARNLNQTLNFILAYRIVFEEDSHDKES